MCGGPEHSKVVEEVLVRIHAYAPLAKGSSVGIIVAPRVHTLLFHASLVLPLLFFPFRPYC